MKRILVVDNDQLFLSFMQDILSREGHEIVTAGSGLSALDILKTFTPDIIFLDMVMPYISGKQLFQFIRGVERLNESRVVILSGIADEAGSDLDKLGVDARLTKGPFDEMAKNVLSMVNQSDTMLAPPIKKKTLLVERYSELILERLKEGVLEFTSDGKIVYANPAALALARIPEGKLLGSRFPDLFGESDRDRVDGILERLADKPMSIDKAKPLNLSERQVTLDILPVRGETSTGIIILGDVTEQKLVGEALRRTAEKNRELRITDSLTSLFTPKHFYDRLEGEIERAHRYELHLSLVLLIVDDFKTFNERYGHIEGDRVLARLGEVILKSLRKTDSAYRYGGAEFVVILPHTKGEFAVDVAERIRTAFEAQAFVPSTEVEVSLTVSMGVAQYLKGEDPKAFVQRASKSMYAAQSDGKNRVVYLTEESGESN